MIGVNYMKYKRQKFIIQPGKVCTFDAENHGKADELFSIKRVLVLEVVKKSIFKPRMVICAPIDENGLAIGDNICVPESVLKPDGFMIIRYPVSSPVISNIDVDTLQSVINILQQSTTDVSSAQIQRLQALNEKLNFYVRSKEV